MIRKWFRRKPLNVLEGGTGANTSEKACENLGAVKKTGDIISGNLEFYGGEDSEGNSVIHPIVNAKVDENGINAVVGGSNNDSSLVLGCGDFANNLEPSGGDLILTAKNFIRFFQVKSGDLVERWRFSTNGYLQHINAYDAKEYYPFSCRRTYTKDNVQKETLAGAVRVNSSIGQTGSFIQGSNNTMFGLQSVDAANANNSNYLYLGAKTQENTSKKIVSFRSGLTGSSTNDSVGKADAEAWRAALISKNGYGISGNDSKTITKWGEWLHLPWTILPNYKDSSTGSLVTTVSAGAKPNNVAQFRIPADAREILLYCRSSSTTYNYGSTLILPRNVIVNLDTDGRTFMLGGGWNNTFGGDAAKIKLSYRTAATTSHNAGHKLLCLSVIGVSVGGSWIGNSWVCYYR